MPEQIDAVPQRRRVRELAEAVRETATGKNVPLNRNIGITPKRKSALNPSSRSSQAASAVTGVEKAAPIRIATGQPAIASGE